jgi:membrane protein DedA with SNARE-associated domain
LFDTALMQTLIQQGYAIIFFVVLLEQLGLPLPGGLLLVIAGAVAGSGQLDFSTLNILAIVACLVADTIWFFLGRRMGSAVLPFICRISFNPDSCVSTTKSIFFRHGSKSLLIAKFVPGINTIAPPLSGVIRMGLSRFLLMDGLGAALWVLVHIAFGFWFGYRLEEATAYLNWAGKLFWLVILLFLALYILWRFIHWKRFVRQMRLARITPEELKEKIDNAEEPFILDVRNALEFEAEPQVIPGALYHPLEKLRKNPLEFPEGREVVLYCD